MGERETKTAYEITQESKAKQEAQAKEAYLKKKAQRDAGGSHSDPFNPHSITAILESRSGAAAPTPRKPKG